MKEARGLVVADLKGRIREWQEAYDMRPSEVKAILLELANAMIGERLYGFSQIVLEVAGWRHRCGARAGRAIHSVYGKAGRETASICDVL
jgi:hypothetical protein